MKAIYTSELKPGDEVINEPFLLQDIVRRTTKDGRPFLLFTLRDKEGQVNGIFWDVPEYIENWIRSGLVALVTGRIVTYKNALQITTTDLNPSPTVDMSDFLPSSRRPREQMIEELRHYIEELAEPWYSLVTTLLLDDEFLPRFANSPAARGMHHAYIGGLLEHTLSMAAIATTLAEHYPHVNRDLLISGTLLHDMGKAIEYTMEESFEYSEDGRLVGHIVRAIVMVEKAAAKLDFPENDLRHLIHLIASHHGTREWGSPVVPKTIEAILLHQLDLLDSRVQGFFDYLQNDDGEESWTLKPSPMFKTKLRQPPDFDK